MAKDNAYASAGIGVVVAITRLWLSNLFWSRRDRNSEVQKMAASAFEIERRQGLAER
jgi:hypothetical protein